MRGTAGWAVAAVVLSLVGISRGDEVRLMTGKIIQGRIVGESAQNVAIEAGGIQFTIARSQVESIRRKPLPSGDAGNSAGPLGADHPDRDLLVKVGPGGVSGGDVKALLARMQTELGIDPAVIGPEQRQAVIERAVRDETLYQAAVAEGVLQTPAVQRLILEVFFARRTLGAINPSTLSSEELESWHREHVERYQSPRRLLLTALVFPADADAAEVSRRHQQAMLDADQTPGWIELGWRQEDQPLGIDLAAADQAAIWRMEAGAVSGILTDPTGLRFVFRVMKVEPSHLAPLGQVRQQVIADVIAARCQVLAERLDQALRAQAEDGESLESVALRQALADGLARRWPVRDAIIETYLVKRGLTRETAAASLRQRFDVVPVQAP